jgi:hypothetical protein
MTYIEKASFFWSRLSPSRVGLWVLLLLPFSQPPQRRRSPVAGRRRCAFFTMTIQDSSIEHCIFWIVT